LVLLASRSVPPRRRGLRSEDQGTERPPPGGRFLDRPDRGWEYPTMKMATVDAKRRLILPGAQPGETYAVREASPGHYELVKVIPVPRPKPTAGELDALLASAPLTPKMSWEELRNLTREP